MRGMSAHVSPRLVALPFSDQGNRVVDGWLLYQRFERRSVTAMRQVTRSGAARYVPPRLPPKATKVTEAPSIEEPFEPGITPHALLVFGALHVLPLLAWVVSDASWTWRSASTLVAAGAAFVLAAALRRQPSRRLVVYGLGVAVLSFARTVGVDWTWSTRVVFLLTVVLAFVLVRAALPPSLRVWLSWERQ
jgi:hypothetical protein